MKLGLAFRVASKSSVLGMLLLSGCSDFFAPARNSTRVNFAIGFAAGGAPEAFDRADRVRISVTTTTGENVLDTTLPFGSGGQETRVRASINSNEGENAIVRAALLRGESPLFVGSAVTVIGQTEPIEITLLEVAASVGGASAMSATGAIGDSIRPSVVALFATGDTIRNAALSWRSDNSAVVLVVGSAVTLRGDGATRVVAEAAALPADLATFLGLTPAQGSIQVQVTIEAATLVVTPNPVTVNIAQTQQLTSVTRDRRGNLINRQPTWTSGNNNIATVSATGVVTGIAAGQTNITARSATLTATVPVTVRSSSSIVGRVANAVNAGPIPGATVTATLSGSVVGTTTTNATGDYSLIVGPGTYQLTVSAQGFVTDIASVTVASGQTATRDFALSPVLPAGQYRIVLTWGSTPVDLDSHLSVQSPNGTAEVFWGNPGSSSSFPFAALDVDDTDGFGPETITIYQQIGQYAFRVENFSGESSIAASGALVRVFNGGTLVMQFSPPNQPGLRWDVFTLSGSTITPIQRISNTVPQSSLGRPSGSGLSKPGKDAVVKRSNPPGASQY